MPVPATAYVLIVPLVLLALYRRVRRNFGRQPLRAGRLAVRVVLFALVATLLLVPGVFGLQQGHLPLGLGAAAGLLAGSLLGLYGLHLTRIEHTPEGRFYTPNGYLGLALTALLLMRLAYRFVLVAPFAAGTSLASDPAAMAALQRSPLTLALAGLLVGYYLSWYAGLLWRTHGPSAGAAVS